MNMPMILVVALSLVTAVLLAWIVYDVRRHRAFSIQDAIALLGVVVSALLVVLPMVLNDSPAAPAARQPELSVTVDGPAEAPIGARTYFTLVSTGASRAEWSVGGFSQGEPFVVEPLGPSHQVYVEPTDASRVGEHFTIAVTVYAADGRSSGATKEFVVTGE
jgi:hypothetical protein